MSKPFCELAQHVVDTIPQNPERTVTLRKILEAKDAAVRAAFSEDVPQDARPPTSARQMAVGTNLQAPAAVPLKNLIVLAASPMAAHEWAAKNGTGRLCHYFDDAVNLAAFLRPLAFPAASWELAVVPGWGARPDADSALASLVRHGLIDLDQTTPDSSVNKLR